MTLKNINIRLEESSDYRVVEELTRDAFWGSMSHPTCDGEHLLVHKLRTSSSFIPALDFVAELDGGLVGHIIYSRAKVVTPSGQEIEVLSFGPLSVLPQYKRTGIGTALISHSTEEAKRLGYRAVIIYGHPDYYPRLGFRRGSDFGITTPNGSSFDALMALPLYDGALDGISGKFYEDAVYNIDSAEAEEFDKAFPPKEPVSLAPIELLTKKLNAADAEVFRQKNIKVLAKLQEFSGTEIMRLSNFNSQVLEIINQTLKEYGYPPKVFRT